MSDWTVKSINENALIKGDQVEGFDLSAKVVKKGDFIKIYNESGIIKTK